MKFGASSLVLALVASLGLCASYPRNVWSQDDKAKEAPPPAAKPAAKEGAKAEEPKTKEEKSAEKSAEKPATAADFPLVHKRWQEVEKSLNELGTQYQLAQSSEERSVLRERYQKLVAESEKLLPQLRSAAEAAFAAEPGKDEDVKRILIGMMAYDYRRDDYDAALATGQKLLALKIEDPVVYALAGEAAYRADDYETAEKYLPIADKGGKLDAEGKEDLAGLPKVKELWMKEQAIRAKEKEADDLPRVKLETSKGTIVVELFENEAPQTVGNFISLVQSKFYDGKTFHRVLAGFMAQGGDPNGNGSGGPGYEIPCECYKPDHRLHFRGSLSMAHAGKDTGGSQFFLTFRAAPQLDGKHTVFGRVIEGLDVLPKLQRRNPDFGRAALPTPDKIVTATVVRKRDHEYVPTKVEAKPEPAKTPANGKTGKGTEKSGKTPAKSPPSVPKVEKSGAGEKSKSAPEKSPEKS